MISIPISFHSDDKGYFDRECPNPDCLYTFKVLMKDWEEKVSDNEVHCPMCGHVDTADKWYTQDQIDQMNNIVEGWAYKYVEETLGKAFKNLERSTQGNKFIKITYKPGKRISFVNNPIGQREEWETEICCEKCGTHYSVIGSAYFCPCCGFNSAISSFNESLNSKKIMLDSIPEMKAMFSEKYNVDAADTMCRKLVEESIGDIVSAFQKFACSKYESISGKKGRTNDFQIVDKGNELFEKCCGKGYGEWLSQDELVKLNVLFQKRHLLEHNDGMIDQKYIDNSKDTTYSLGQRVIVRGNDAYELLRLVEKLGQGLLTL